MAQDTSDSLSQAFGVAAGASAALKDRGADLLDLLQQITENPRFADELVKLKNEHRYYKVTDDLGKGPLRDFIVTVFTDRATSKPYDGSPDEQLYSSSAALRELMQGLTPLEISLLVMHYGLDGSSPEPLERVAEHHGMQHGPTQGAIHHAEYKLLRAHLVRTAGRTVRG